MSKRKKSNSTVNKSSFNCNKEMCSNCSSCTNSNNNMNARSNCSNNNSNCTR